MPDQNSGIEKLTVVVPVLNEVGEISAWLRHVSRRLPGATVVVADGGSTDGTVEAVASILENPRLRMIDNSVESLNVLVSKAPRGRGSQLRQGTRTALEEGSPTHFLFLHADTALTDESVRALGAALEDPAFRWGWFDVQMDGPSLSERIIARGITWRARLTGRPTGDQGLLITRQHYLAVGGYEPIALFEDVDIVARLKRTGLGKPLGAYVVTSGRRYRRWGYWTTVFRMWGMRLRYWLGASPEEIYRRYG
jgi:rSAM/selenodomain-associated transferase 2